MRSGAKKALFALVPLMVVMGGAEFGLRTADWPKPDGSFEHNEPFWVTPAGLSSKVYAHKESGGSFVVSSNIDGLRAPLHDPEKGPDTWRVMALGCSTTFGWGVDDAQSYPARLQQLIAEQGHANVEVINGGQPGYTSFQGRWLWEETLHRYAPDVVLIGYVVQDARKAAYTDKSQAVLQQDHRFMKDNLLYRSRLYLGLRDLLGSVQVRAKERPEDGSGGVDRVPPSDYADNLRHLVDKVRQSGAMPVLFGYPLEREGYTSRHRLILQAAASELHVSHLDLQDRMDTASRAEVLYFEQDRGHANAAGNARIAQWVFEFLQKQSLLGESK
jgi:lysophospholipase L1-like esterase